MKTFASLSLVVVAAALALAAVAPAPAPAPGTLQVQVTVPPTWRPMLEDYIADKFVSQIEDVFRRRGFKGQIVEVSNYEEPSAGCFLLTVNLMEWRMNRIGNIDCTFGATLQTDHAVRNLGLFTQTAFRWMTGPGRFGLASAFDEAAQSAVRELYDKLARTQLVPNLRQP